jgi:hypothetical protein
MFGAHERRFRLRLEPRFPARQRAHWPRGSGVKALLSVPATGLARRVRPLGRTRTDNEPETQSTNLFLCRSSFGKYPERQFYGYTIGASDDSTQFPATPVIDNKNNQSTAKTQIATFPAQVSGRYLRITVTSLPPNMLPIQAQCG